jgi:hypothetical protein
MLHDIKCSKVSKEIKYFLVMLLEINMTTKDLAMHRV